MRRLPVRLGGLVLMVLLVWARPSPAQYADWTHPAWTYRRRVSVTVPENVPVERLTAVVRFKTFGGLKPDGSDLRVLVARREVPYRILQIGPGDEVTVAFGLTRNLTSYVLYFGNPKAKAPAEQFDIQAGLLLEMRKLPTGKFRSVAQAKALFERSRGELGADFVENIFGGCNPFGPSGGFVARYSGFLDIKNHGTYTFASTSTHSSFLLVDGKVVVTCRARHRAPRRARFTGKLKLTTGIHRFEYFHVHPWGNPTAVAAWRPPGSRRFVAIPADAFVPVAYATAGPLRKYKARVTPDFTFTRTEAVLTPDGATYLQRYRFTDMTAAINHANYTPRWDFGDGITSTLWTPSHVYLVDGPVKVSLTVRGPLGKATSVQTIVVARDWPRQADKNVDRLKDYQDLVRSYKFTKMPTSHVVRMAYFFERLGNDRDLLNVSRHLVFDRIDMSSADRRDRGMTVVELLRGKLDNPGEALRFLDQLEKGSTSADLKAGFALLAGRINVDDIQQLDRAREHFNRILTDYRTASPQNRRRALMGLGDVAWLAHDGTSAAEDYRRAERIALRKKGKLGEPVKVGHLARVIEEMLRLNELDRAEESLGLWEWERPTDRLLGYSTILRAKLLIARGKARGALQHLEALVAVNPKSLYAPEALLLSANCLQSLERFPEAAKVLRRILVEYPESGLTGKAAERLKSLER